MARKILSNGIDVSYANGYLDWEKIKGQIDWAIIRVGYGSDYTNQDDSQYRHNIESCEKLGIPYGVYLYSYADTVVKAKSEAAHAIRLLKGYKPAMPLYYDLEENKIAQLGNEKILSIARTFCDAVTKAGYVFGVYANLNWWNNYLTDAWYNNYSRWLAQYNAVCTYKGKYDIWQYTSTGRLEGVPGKFDRNHCYRNFFSVPNVKGDLDNDGKVSSKDARTALRYAAGLEKLTDAQVKKGDMNGDGKLTSADARDILRKAAGIQ